MYSYEQVRLFLSKCVKKYLINEALIRSYMNTLNIFGDCFIPKDYSSTGNPEYLPKKCVFLKMLKLSNQAY
jgi:hypothetical protein